MHLAVGDDASDSAALVPASPGVGAQGRPELALSSKLNLEAAEICRVV